MAANYKFDKFDGVVIESSTEIMKNQANRASKNYDFQKLKSGKALLWTLPSGITFNVMEDRSGGEDKVIYTGIVDGSRTPFPEKESELHGLYIASPKCDGYNQDTFEVAVEVVDAAK